MAEKAKGAGTADERDLLPQEDEQDLLFQVQMGVANFILGYWKHGLGLVGVILVATLVVGLVQTSQRDAQRAVHGEMGKVLFGLSADPGDAELVTAAKQLETIGDEGKGTAQAMAYLQAGEVFAVAKADADALRAYEKAHALGPPGVLGWAAASGLAAQKAKAGKADEAIGLYQPYADGEGAEAQEALLSIASLRASTGDVGGAKASIEQLTTRFPDTPYADRVGELMRRIGS